MNIYLIGMRAAGKSSVGRLLADQLHFPFIDMDRELSSEFKHNISDYVHSHGWQAFRRRETALLKRIATLKGHIVATGGGVIGSEANIPLMRASGWVVWLKAGLTALKQRLNKDGSTAAMRPPLGGKGEAVDELETLLESREGAYRRAMHFAVDTEGCSVEMISRRIADRYIFNFIEGKERPHDCHGRK